MATKVNAAPEPDHRPSADWRGTPGVREVLTPSYAKARIVATETLRKAGVTAFLGDPGLGKTFALAALARRIGADAVFFTAPTRLARKRFIIRLLEALGCNTNTACFSETDHTDKLCDHLALELSRRSRAVLIDEVDLIGADGLGIVRWAWAQPGNRAAFFLAGEKADQTLRENHAVNSRIEEVVRFRRLTEEEALVAYREFHDVFREASDNQLLRLHAVTDGVMRAMAQALATILEHADPAAPRLTDELIRAVEETERLRDAA